MHWSNQKRGRQRERETFAADASAAVGHATFRSPVSPTEDGDRVSHRLHRVVFRMNTSVWLVNVRGFCCLPGYKVHCCDEISSTGRKKS